MLLVDRITNVRSNIAIFIYFYNPIQLSDILHKFQNLQLRFALWSKKYDDNTVAVWYF